MKKNNNEILGGFSAMFDTLSPNEDIKIKGVEVVEDPNDPTNDTNAFDLEDEDEFEETPALDTEDEEDVEEVEEDKEPKAKEEKEVEASAEETAEAETVGALFDSIAESVGWTDIAEDEKPKSVEGLIDYMKAAVEASSVPEYANDDIASLDAYVKAGGSIEDYLNVAKAGTDYDSLDIEDTTTQKQLIREYLSEKGFSDTQIKRKLEKYEDADLLEDEATDALEFLKESKEQNKKALLESQNLANQAAIESQQTFYNSVVDEIESLNDVRGIQIPKTDKKALMEYIFKVEADGRTKYQKEYAKSTKNLIESAYFTMKGDALISQAKRSGETSAVSRLKQTLSSNKISGSKQTINNGSAVPLWSLASQQLLRKPQ